MTGLTKILILCVDAADSKLIENWSRQGHLPNWQTLQRRGLVTRVENAVGLYTGTVWPSFQSGLGPGGHGRYYLKQIKTGSYRNAGINADASDGKVFWDVLGRAGRRARPN